MTPLKLHNVSNAPSLTDWQINAFSW